MKKIEIILSTYNGGQYLRRQLDSLFSQTYTSWHLTIRDDGSLDDTMQIISDYASCHPDKISIDKSSGHNIGVIKSFELLLASSDSNCRYFMFCDQDDVWLPNKISNTYNKIVELERLYGTDTPLMVHTDLVVVDEQENIIDQSFWHYTNIRPQLLDPNPRLLSICNSATGCTIMINRASRNIVLPFPANIMMHDAWIAAAVCRKGKVCGLQEQTILYRQHHSNTLGAVKYTHNPLKKIFNLGRVLRETDQIYKSYPNIFHNRLEIFLTKIHYSLILFFTKSTN